MKPDAQQIWSFASNAYGWIIGRLICEHFKKKKKNQMPGPPREGQLMWTFKCHLQDGSGALGDISREDLARVLVECLQHSPKKALVFSVENRQDDAPEDLASQMSRLRETVPV